MVSQWSWFKIWNGLELLFQALFLLLLIISSVHNYELKFSFMFNVMCPHHLLVIHVNRDLFWLLLLLLVSTV